jgi:hypothetical protein
MRRRNFIALLGSTIVMVSLAARAQQSGRMRRVGLLMSYPETDSDAQAFLAAFREGLQKLGWKEGRNVRLDTRWTLAGNVGRCSDSRKSSSRSSPTFFLGIPRPLRSRCRNKHAPFPSFLRSSPTRLAAAYFPHPGGNVTGFMVMEPTMAGKWLELLKEIAPRLVAGRWCYESADARLRCGPGSRPISGNWRTSSTKHQGNLFLRRRVRRRACRGHRTRPQTEGPDRSCLPWQGVCRIRQSLRRRNDGPRRLCIRVRCYEELRCALATRYRFSIPGVLSGAGKNSASGCAARSTRESLLASFGVARQRQGHARCRAAFAQGRDGFKSSQRSVE